MESQHLQLFINEGNKKADEKVKWILYLDNDAVFHGEVDSHMDTMCADFYVKRRAELMQGAPRCVRERL